MSGIMLAAAAALGLGVTVSVGAPVFTGTTLRTQRRTLTPTISNGSGSYTYAWTRISNLNGYNTFIPGSAPTSSVFQTVDTSMGEDFQADTDVIRLVLTDTITGQMAIRDSTVALS